MNILIAGDFCPRGSVNVLLENGLYSQVLGDVRNVISDCDYAIVNFECPVTDGKEGMIFRNGPTLRCGEKGVESVKWAGFNCVTLANNHFYDYGDNGASNTIDVCKRVGIDVMGG